MPLTWNGVAEGPEQELPTPHRPVTSPASRPVGVHLSGNSGSVHLGCICHGHSGSPRVLAPSPPVAAGGRSPRRSGGSCPGLGLGRRHSPRRHPVPGQHPHRVGSGGSRTRSRRRAVDPATGDGADSRRDARIRGRCGGRPDAALRDRGDHPVPWPECDRAPAAERCRSRDTATAGIEWKRQSRRPVRSRTGPTALAENANNSIEKHNLTTVATNLGTSSADRW